MNTTLLKEEAQVETTDSAELLPQMPSELCVVELAYVGGGMANVSFV